MIIAFIFGTILLELIIVGWIDFKTSKISNKWVFVNAVTSLLMHLGLRQFYPLSLEVLIFPVGFLIIGFLLFLLNVMGAGDSKFLASLFLIVPLEYHMLFFERLVVSTIVTGVCLIVVRTIRNHHAIRAFLVSQYWQGIKIIFKSRFSYAPVIFMAWILLGFNLWN